MNPPSENADRRPPLLPLFEHATDSIPQLKRDLLWALNGPSLLQTANEDECVRELNWNEEAVSVEEIANWFPTGAPTQVGYYFEKLIHFYLERLRKFEMVATGLQVFEGTRTIGELDFVFRNETGELEHWETAVKFYLLFPDSFNSQTRHQPPDGSELIGPNATDNFQKKTNRLLTHQLPLGQQQLGAVRSRAFVRGMIFYPLEEIEYELPSHLADDHLHGHWFYAGQLDAFHQWSDFQFCVLNKPWWLGSVAGIAPTALLSADAMHDHLKRHFQQSHWPQMVSVINTKAEREQEQTRFIIVPDSWPETG